MRLKSVNRGPDGYVAEIGCRSGEPERLTAKTVASLQIAVLGLVDLSPDSMSQVNDIFTCVIASEVACQRRRGLILQEGHRRSA